MEYQYTTLSVDFNQDNNKEIWGEVKKTREDILAEHICRICREHTRCTVSGICTMAYIEAEELIKLNYKQPQKADWIPRTYEYQTKQAINSRLAVMTPTSWECSNCGKAVIEASSHEYCPKCGCQMMLTIGIK